MENPYDAATQSSLAFLSAESQIEVTETAWKVLKSFVADFEHACSVMPDQEPETWKVAVSILKIWPPSQVQTSLREYMMLQRENFHTLPLEFPAFIQVVKMLVFDWILEHPSRGWQLLIYFQARNSSWNMSKAFNSIQVPASLRQVPASLC
jgi:hypothetical protein